MSYSSVTWDYTVKTEQRQEQNTVQPTGSPLPSLCSYSISSNVCWSHLYFPPSVLLSALPFGHPPQPVRHSIRNTRQLEPWRPVQQKVFKTNIRITSPSMYCSTGLMQTRASSKLMLHLCLVRFWGCFNLQIQFIYQLLSTQSSYYVSLVWQQKVVQ